MEQIQIQPNECLLCLKPIEIKAEVVESLQSLERSLLKLLQVEKPKIPYSSYSETKDLFCQTCSSRNEKILSIFSQIEALGKDLEDLKNVIEGDFRNSESIIKDRTVSTVNVEAKLGLKQCLRYSISKSLCPPEFPTFSPKNTEPTLEDDWFESPEDLPVESFPNTADPFYHAKKFHGIRELSVKVKRLPRNVLSKRRIHINSLPGSLSPKPLKCIFADCPSKKIFASPAERDKHVRVSHGNFVPMKNDVKRSANFKCVMPGCNATFNQKLERYLHLRKFHTNRNKWKKLLKEEYAKPVFKCIFADCDAGDFHSEEARDAHVEKEHGSVSEANVEKIRCVFADCDSQDFVTEEARDEHVKVVHSDFKEFTPRKDKPLGTVTTVPPSRIKFFCTVEDCPRKRGFITENELELHKRVCHDGLKKSYQCKECGKYFSKKNLWSHVQTVHLNIRKFICHFCGYACSATPALKRHLVTHTNERNYQCKICEKEFKTPEGVKIHTRYAHTGERPYRCDRCGKGFVTQGHLGKHMKCVHNKDERPHICEICGKTFPIHGYLHEHMKNSHGDTPRRRNPKPKDSTKKKQEVIPPNFIPMVPMLAPEVEDSSNSFTPEDPARVETSRYIPSVPVNLSFFEDRFPGAPGLVPQFTGINPNIPGPSNFKNSHPYFQNMEQFGFPRNN